MKVRDTNNFDKHMDIFSEMSTEKGTPGGEFDQMHISVTHGKPLVSFTNGYIVLFLTDKNGVDYVPEDLPDGQYTISVMGEITRSTGEYQTWLTEKLLDRAKRDNFNYLNYTVKLKWLSLLADLTKEPVTLVQRGGANQDSVFCYTRGKQRAQLIAVIADGLSFDVGNLEVKNHIKVIPSLDAFTIFPYGGPDVPVNLADLEGLL